MAAKQNYINHIAMVLDMSLSMWGHKGNLIKVADGQIAHLAQRSKELDQETRITVYTFNTSAQCVIYDKDVLRLPSIAEFYNPTGGTALIDATMGALDDLAMTPEKYGDHAFLIYVLTDGEENSSRKFRSSDLTHRIEALPGHWTLASLVPNAIGKHEAKRFGFLSDNIAIWDTSSTQGVQEVGAKIKAATDTFMDNRTKGVRGTKNLFGGKDTVNDAAIAAAGLKPLAPSEYFLVPVPPQPADRHGEPIKIKEFVEGCNHRYQIGKAYYQLNKREKIQGNKAVAVLEKKTSKVFVGPQARKLVGLPDTEVRANPDANPDYSIFVQSTSVNRYLEVGTKLLLMAH